MGEVWPTAHITELCLQLTAGSRPVNGDEHRALRSQSCETALLTTADLPYLTNYVFDRTVSTRPGAAQCGVLAGILEARDFVLYSGRGHPFPVLISFDVDAFSASCPQRYGK